MRIAEARFATRRLDAQKAFYGGALGLPPLEDDGRIAAFGVGDSRLVFAEGRGDEPMYHFVFDVPRNKLSEAKAWLAKRVGLLERDGRDEFEFPSWNATAAYFRDPAGNVVELIARHNLPNDSGAPFGPGDLLRVSEVGVAVGDVPTAVRGLERDLGLEVWNEPNEEFTTVGDEEGLLIVVKCGRPWFPTGEADRPHPVVVVARGDREASHAPPNQGYRIVECVRDPERVNGAGAELPPGSAGSDPTSSSRS
jgi:catechol-2,3-dioxygenase